MNYHIKIIDLKNCKSTDEVYDCFAESLNFSCGKDKSSEELKKQISKLDSQLFSNVIIHNYSSVKNLGGTYFNTFLSYLFDLNKDNFEKVRIDTDYISKSIFSNKFTIGKLFFDKPGQYGYRGDIGLWDDLEKYFSSQELPENENLLVNIISEAIIKITGNSVFKQETFAVEKYNHGGMSGGSVSNEFWTRKAIPLIMARMMVIKQEKNKSDNWFKKIISKIKSHFQ